MMNTSLDTNTLSEKSIFFTPSNENLTDNLNGVGGGGTARGKEDYGHFHLLSDNVLELLNKSFPHLLQTPD